MIKRFFNRDSIGFGMVLGIVIPVACFLIIYYLDSLALKIFDKNQILTIIAMQLIALCSNLPLFRAYMLRWDKEQTGKGMLLATFVLAFIYIYLNRHQILN